MEIELSIKEFRRLLDLVYIGNWILNSTRDFNDHIKDYDDVESKLFSYCQKAGMFSLYDRWQGKYLPSKAFEEGGIHEAIADYEDAVFFDILAEELARRDLNIVGDVTDMDEFNAKLNEYLDEFEKNGIDNVNVEMEA